jgi:preprotein translocase subunit SecG
MGSLWEKVLRGIKPDSKKHFEPKSVAWAWPTSRQLSKHCSWRKTHTQAQFYAACLLAVICTAYPEFRVLNVVMWTVIVKLHGSCTIPTLFITQGQIWHHTSNCALYILCSIHTLARHSLLANVIPFHGTNNEILFGPLTKISEFLALTVAWLVMLYIIMCKYLIAYFTQSKNKLVTQIVKFIYIPPDNATFTVPIFK